MATAVSIAFRVAFAGLLLATSCRAAAQQRAQEPPWKEVAITSTNQRYEARIAKAAGQEQVADVLARWKLTVREKDAKGELWSCIVRHRPGQRLHLLTDDGASLVEVAPEYDNKTELVRAWRIGKELCGLTASALDVPRSAAGADKMWFLDGERAPVLGWIESPRGPAPQLFLQLRGGGERRVDLETGEVFATREWVGEQPVVGPALDPLDPKLRDAVKMPIVSEVTAPAQIHWGEALEVQVSGSFPTPNWVFCCFESKTGEDPHHIVLVAQSIPPPPDSRQLQVLRGFQTKATITGLTPGKYVIEVSGREDQHPAPVEVEVLRARTLVELRTQGGFLGLDEKLRVYPNGVAVLESPKRGGPIFSVVSRADYNAILAHLSSLPAVDRSSSTPHAADMFRYTLQWTANGRESTQVFDDGTLEAGVRELIGVLRALVP